MTYIERILAEIDRQILKLNDEEPSDFIDGAITQTKYFKRFIGNLPKEPASEDLEKEIDRYFNTEGIPVTAGALRDTARHFAQWQREQLKKIVKKCEAQGNRCNTKTV